MFESHSAASHWVPICAGMSFHGTKLQRDNVHWHFQIMKRLPFQFPAIFSNPITPTGIFHKQTPNIPPLHGSAWSAICVTADATLTPAAIHSATLPLRPTALWCRYVLPDMVTVTIAIANHVQITPSNQIFSNSVIHNTRGMTWIRQHIRTIRVDTVTSCCEFPNVSECIPSNLHLWCKNVGSSFFFNSVFSYLPIYSIFPSNFLHTHRKLT